MSSLRQMTLPGLLAVLATLALRMEAGEAEWLAASLLQATGQLRLLLTRISRVKGRHLARLMPLQPHACPAS